MKYKVKGAGVQVLGVQSTQEIKNLKRLIRAMCEFGDGYGMQRQLLIWDMSKNTL